MRNKFVAIIFSVSVFFLILSFSIALPIYVRPFYYAHIDALDLSEKSGYSYGEIKEAYDSLLDYLTMPNKDFSTGVFEYSADGKAHFEDCKMLFLLDTVVLSVSATAVLLICVLFILKKIQRPKIGKRSAEFYSALAAVLIPSVVGGLAVFDFDNAFKIFHTIFFPGKSNWIFNPFEDQIIKVMPKKFFMNCAILIATSVVVISLVIVAKEIVSVMKEKKA